MDRKQFDQSSNHCRQKFLLIANNLATIRSLATKVPFTISKDSPLAANFIVSADNAFQGGSDQPFEAASRLGEFDTPRGGKSQKLILVVSNSILGANREQSDLQRIFGPNLWRRPKCLVNNSILVLVGLSSIIPIASTSVCRSLAAKVHFDRQQFHHH